MDKYIKCLRSANETAKESTIADFEFSEPREAIIFAQWMGAVLPIDGNEWFSLPDDLPIDKNKRFSVPGELKGYEEGQLLLSESMVSSFVSPNYLLERRYVRFVPPLTIDTADKFEGRKKIFNEEAYSQIISDIVKTEHNPQEFILIGLDKEKYSQYNESFWEYIAGCYLRGKGYLVTRRKPNGMKGDPDMYAYKTPSVVNPLRRYKFVKGGCFLVELELPLIFGEATESPAADETEERSVAVEAKDQTDEETEADKQLKRYLEDGYFFDEGYITGPDFDHIHRIGVISNTAEGELLHYEYNKRKTSHSLLKNKQEVLNQVKRLVKLVLAKNLSFSRLLELCREKQYSEITFRGFLNELSSILEHMTVDDVCSLVQEEGLNRFGYKRPR